MRQRLLVILLALIWTSPLYAFSILLYDNGTRALAACEARSPTGTCSSGGGFAYYAWDHGEDGVRFSICRDQLRMPMIAFPEEGAGAVCVEAIIDLVGGNFSVANQKSIFAIGDTLVLNGGGANEGYIESGITAGGVYLSVDGIFNSQDIKIGSVPLSTIPPQEDFSYSGAEIIIPEVPEDDYTVLFVPNDFDVLRNQRGLKPLFLKESDYSNNAVAGPMIKIGTIVDLPDLEVSLEMNVTMSPVVVFPGQTIDTSLTLKNKSAHAAFDAVVVGGIVLSADANLDVDDIGIFVTQSASSYAPGETVTTMQSVTIPENTPSGDYYLIGVVNTQGYFDAISGGAPDPEEEDFGNNLSKVKITVALPKVEIEICVGNPISTNSGRKFETELDYQGYGPFPLQFSRFYSSQPGTGWNFSYSRRLLINENPETTDIILVFDGGQRYEFFDIDNQGFSDPDVPGFLVRAAHGFSYLDESGTTHQFDQSGTLVGLISLTGFTQSLFYVDDQLIRISDQFGKSLQLSYTDKDQVETLTTPDNRVFRYEYDSDGLLTAVLLPDSTRADDSDNPRRRYLYESENLAHGLTGVVDENGHRYATFDYDERGRAILSTHDHGADQNVIAYYENETTVTNPLGKDTTYFFEKILGSKRLTRVDGAPTINCPATSMTRSYDSRGSVTEEIDRKGNITRFTYTHTGLPDDEYLYHVGLVTNRTEAAGTLDARTTTIEWHPDFRLPAVITEPGRKIELTYDDNARLIERTETALDTGSERTWVNQYDEIGLLIGINGPRTDVHDVTSLRYNDEGELTTITNALGHSTIILGHDANGLPVTLQDPNGLITQLAYDERLRLVTQRIVSDAGDATTRITYDEKGNVTAITLPDGQTLQYQYDLTDRLLKISNDLGESIEFNVDAGGNRTTEITRDASHAIVRVQNRAFDELSRLITTIGAANQTTRFGYDDNDNLQWVEDALGRQTRLGFDGLDRLISVTDALQGDSTFTYDDRDNLIQVTDAQGVITSFDYDGLNNLLAEHSTARGTTHYQYDTAGNRTRAIDANGITMAVTYDALNRLTSIDYNGAPEENITYQYDKGDAGIGRLTGTADASGTTIFSYDDRGNLLTDQRLIAGVGYSTRYAYNLANQLTQVIYPSGRIVNYALDGISRVTSITTQVNGASAIEAVASNFDYLPFGPVTGWRHGNGLTTSIGYDKDYRVTKFEVADSDENLDATDLEKIMSFTYGYNQVSNITRILDNLGIHSQSFAYDELNRLTGASGNYFGQSSDIDYTYDGVGNRLSRTITADSAEKQEAYRYQSGSHRLTAVDTTDSEGTETRSFTHDGNGNTLSDANSDLELGMVINASNRLAAIYKDGDQIGAYTYNARGQRVAKTSTYRGRLHANFDRSNRDTAEINNGKSGGMGNGKAKNDGKGRASTDPLHVATDNKKVTEKLHFHYDQLGNLIAESDDSGHVIREYMYIGNFRIAMTATSMEQGGPQADQRLPLTLYYLHNDHLGTTGKVTDENQRVVWSSEQTPFGETSITTQALRMPMRFPGQYADLESGFSYNYFRDYDPSLGRYIQSDPIGLRGGYTNFIYANSDPIHYVDPKGTFGLVGATIGFVTSATSAFQAAIAAGRTNEEALKVAGAFGVIGAIAGGFAGPVGIKESAAVGAGFGGSSNLVTAVVLTGTVEPISQIKATLFGAINGAIANALAFRSSLSAVRSSSNLGSSIVLGSGLAASLSTLLSILENAALDLVNKLKEGECN